MGAWMVIAGGVSAYETPRWTRMGNLNGTHLDIVTPNQPGFTNMYAADGQLLPAAQWTGYFPDLVGWIASQSGMTYTLYAPTTNASGCESATNGNYGCGQKDVTEIGVRDMYMGLYYVTPSRLEAGLMTRSFTGDAGTLASALILICLLCHMTLKQSRARMRLRGWRSQLTCDARCLHRYRRGAEGWRHGHALRVPDEAVQRVGGQAVHAHWSGVHGLGEA